jgi:hypothetical protein
MNVLALTIFVSTILAGMFALLWIAAACTPHSFSDRDALLPLDDDSPPNGLSLRTRTHEPPAPIDRR